MRQYPGLTAGTEGRTATTRGHHAISDCEAASQEKGNVFRNPGLTTSQPPQTPRAYVRRDACTFLQMLCLLSRELPKI